MRVFSGPFSSAALLLALLGPALVPVAQAQAPAKAAPSERAALRAAVAAYSKQKLQQPQELALDQVRELQDVGQALLASQAKIPVSPAAEALRQEIIALRGEIDQALLRIDTPRYEAVTVKQQATAPVTEGTIERVELRDSSGKVVGRSGPPVGKPGKVAASQQAAVAPAAEEMITAADSFGGVRNRLANLKLRAAAAESAANKTSGSPSQRLRTQQLAKKAGELQDVTKALIEGKPTRENRVALARLRDRLTEKSLSTVIGEQRQNQNEVPDPTLTTIVRHR